MKKTQVLRCCLSVLLIATVMSASATDQFITLASTTSTQASGFFDYYLPIFKKKTGIEVRVVAVGTGQALRLGEHGDADLLLVHDKIGELKFIKEGFGLDRREVMYNCFVIIGPEDDPAKINGMTDAILALQRISASKSGFISRGDDSGTHRLELRLWKQAQIEPKTEGASWYKEAGRGMGGLLNMLAANRTGYTVSDQATWIAFQNRSGLELLVEGDSRLFNQYSVMLVNPKKHKHIKHQQALIFMDWMTSPEGQQAIADFKMQGEKLFTPNANK